LVVAWLLLCAWAMSGARGEVVFDNSEHYLTNYYASLLEFGDELVLDGSARTVSTFQFEYFGAFLRTGDETVRIRFYDNTGPGRFAAPNNLLFDSGSLPIFSGLNTVPLTGLSVAVPSRFTWTAEFDGLSGVAGDEAGLVFYHPPIVGRSGRDFWQKQGNGWVLLSFPNLDPAANFGVRVLAGPEPDIRLVSLRRAAGGGWELRATGPIGARAAVQATSDLTTWRELAEFTFTNSVHVYVDRSAGAASERFYRIGPQLQAMPVYRIEAARMLAGGIFELQVRGVPSKRIVTQASGDLVSWTNISTNVFHFTSDRLTVLDRQAGALGQRFYRVQAP
jgi:hypothetical protein